PYNTPEKVTEIKNGWGKTTYGGKTGWFSLDYAKTVGTGVRGVKVTAPTKTSYYVGEELNTSGMKVTVLYQNNTSKTITSGYTISGMPATTTGKKDVYVTYGGKSAKFSVTITAKPNDDIYCVITSSNGVNLRSGAGTSYDTVGALPSKAEVTVTETKNGWGKTTYGGKTGWFSLEYCYAVGDADSNKSITANDALMILKSVVGKSQTGFDKTAADANRDGKVKSDDALRVLQRVVGKITILKANATPNGVTPTEVVVPNVTPTEPPIQ
ncbi:MAG: bacterial Ig-like domain-containing protein, partial [Clostridia bacterium]|nr:bacterial Ig-like domain-containing protein [Clostridia bacterium]